MKSMAKAVLAALALILAAAPAYAEQTDNTQRGWGGSPGGGGRMGPPPFAYTHCEGKSEGASIEVNTPRGDKISGTCVKDENGKLFFRPDNPPMDRGRRGQMNQGGQYNQGGGQRMGPPPFIKNACEGKAPGSTVEVETPDGRKITGKCESMTVFRPDNPPMEGGGGDDGGRRAEPQSGGTNTGARGK